MGCDPTSLDPKPMLDLPSSVYQWSEPSSGAARYIDNLATPFPRPLHTHTHLVIEELRMLAVVLGNFQCVSLRAKSLPELV